MRVETIGDATLYLGACEGILPTLPRVDAVITDPPYGIGYSPGAGGRGWIPKTFIGDDIVYGDNAPFDPTFLLSLAPVVITWGANHYADKLPARASWLIWDKREGSGTNDFADCEIAWSSVGGPARLLRHLWNGAFRASERGIQREHPTQKPLIVMRWCIEQAGNPETILDPYMGVGTTGVAAIQLNRKFIGIEREERYFDIACRRIEQACAQGVLFAHEAPRPVQMGIEEAA